MRQVPSIRVRSCNGSPVREDGAFVLYWMHAQRRLGWNFALQRAAELAIEHRRPLLILEALRCDYPWASDRHHAFVLEGMREHQQRLDGAKVGYYAYLEPEAGAGSGLLAALAARAVCVVADDHPGFFYPRMLKRAADSIDAALEAVDGCGIVPVREPGRFFPTAFSFRRWLQRNLGEALKSFPAAEPLDDERLPPFEGRLDEIEQRWPALPRGFELDTILARLPLDHEVARIASRQGGREAARRELDRFLEEGLPRYSEARNRPQERVTSRLSPYLHHGHISPHELFSELARREEWNFSRISGESRGARAGWWGMSADAEAFLDQLITWRELGLNAATFLENHEDYESLPRWARETLSEHESDPRPHVYDLETLEAGRTHDALWNAAQMQLVREGEIHNYLRMLWGKKILEWSASPRRALDCMVQLNDKYALDGRDPNSTSGIFWVLGRYDRAWGPERPIFGKIRYMSSENTARKLRVKEYVERHGSERLV